MRRVVHNDDNLKVLFLFNFNKFLNTFSECIKIKLCAVGGRNDDDGDESNNDDADETVSTATTPAFGFGVWLAVSLVVLAVLVMLVMLVVLVVAAADVCRRQLDVRVLCC